MVGVVYPIVLGDENTESVTIEPTRCITPGLPSGFSLSFNMAARPSERLKVVVAAAYIDGVATVLQQKVFRISVYSKCNFLLTYIVQQKGNTRSQYGTQR